MIREAGFEVERSSHADIVVVAMSRTLSYEDIEAATLSIWRGADFIGTNADAFYPTERGFLPGSGTMVAALQASTDRKARIMGKPERAIYQLALEKLHLEPNQVACIGDRLDTDIAGGKKAGMTTILVTTGVGEIHSTQISSIKPDYTVRNLEELID
jgi:4-nitrophenyl phosphatase